MKTHDEIIHDVDRAQVVTALCRETRTRSRTLRDDSDGFRRQADLLLASARTALDELRSRREASQQHR